MEHRVVDLVKKAGATGDRALLRRRGILAAAAAAAAALMSTNSSKVAEANDGQNLVLGSAGNTSTNPTVLVRTGSNANAFTVTNSDGGAIVGSSTNNSGVIGSSGSSVGMFGSSTANAGVFGNSSNYAGVFGLSSPGPGTYGQATSGTGSLGASSNGVGAQGSSNSAQGVFGSSQGSSGVQGSSNNGAGVRGDSQNNNGVVGSAAAAGSGVFGISNTGFGVFGQATAGIGIYGTGPTAGRFDGPLVVNGDFSATGMKSAVVVAADGDTKRLYCVESPESWFEDVGFGTLANGSSPVQIDQGFASVVNLDRPYHVFVTAYGDCNGLGVADQGSQGFTVRELRGGQTSGVRFSYRILAYRRDIDAPRLQQVRIQTQRLNATHVTNIGPAPEAPQLPESRPVPTVRPRP